MAQAVTIRLQKCIFGLLIICIGGLGSLAYSDSFLPGHEHHAYHLSILEQPDADPDSLPPSPERSAHRLDRWLASRFMAGPAVFVTHQDLPPGAGQFFQSDLHDGYLLTVAHVDIVNNTSLSESVLKVFPTARSAWLPPPKKPPELSFAQAAFYPHSKTGQGL